MAGFVKAMRTEEADFLDKYPIANHVLNVIARRARRTPCKMTGLDVGECFIGHKGLGITEQQYRTAKKQLTKWDLAEFKRGKRATDVGTVAKLTNSMVYDINETEGNGRVTDEERNSNVKLTTNKECKNGIMEEETSLVPAKPEPRSKFKFNDDDFALAEWMYKRVQVINPSTKQPNLKSWANTIRLMRDIDKRDHRQIGELFDWANRDSFWCSNILSPDKLRKQWDKLNTKRLNNHEGYKSNTEQYADGRSDTERRIAEARARRDGGETSGGLSVGHNGGNVYEQVDEEEWGDCKQLMDPGASKPF